jgi:hypothetical protein
MKTFRKLKSILREILRFAKWLVKHYDEFAPIVEMARKLVAIAETEGGSGDAKFERVRERALKMYAGRSVKPSALNLAIERAVCEMNDDAAKELGER